MTEYTTFDLVLTEVELSEAYDALRWTAWGEIETTVQELRDMESVADHGGVSLYYNHVSDTYIFVDDKA